MLLAPFLSSFFFFNDTAPTEIYTLSLHDALPIYDGAFETAAALDLVGHLPNSAGQERRHYRQGGSRIDRKSTRLNSSHVEISYAVFCLKKKKKNKKQIK